MTEFSVNLHNARCKKGLTQTELAEKIGVTHSMIAHMENGFRVPNIVLAVKIARELDTTCEELVFGKIATSSRV